MKKDLYYSFMMGIIIGMFFWFFIDMYKKDQMHKRAIEIGYAQIINNKFLFTNSDLQYIICNQRNNN